jgi:hypothetical protein
MMASICFHTWAAHRALSLIVVLMWRATLLGVSNLVWAISSRMVLSLSGPMAVKTRIGEWQSNFASSRSFSHARVGHRTATSDDDQGVQSVLLVKCEGLQYGVLDRRWGFNTLESILSN